MSFIQETYLQVINFIFVVFLILLNIYIAFKYIKKLKLIKTGHHNIIWLLFGVHFLFAVLYFFLSYTDTSDAMLYYQDAKIADSWFNLFSLGTGVIKFIVYPFVKFGFSYLNVFMIFSTFGAIGFYKLYVLFLEELLHQKKHLNFQYVFLFLLPSFHFYTSGIGKDALVFYLLISLFSLIKRSDILNYSSLFFFLTLFLIRPHIAVFLLISYFLVLFFYAKLKLMYKFGLILITLLFILIATPILEQKINIKFSSLDSVEQTLNRIQSYGKRIDMGSSSIDVTEKGVTFKMFAYAYLPMIWKADSVLKFIVSLENIYLFIILFFSILKSGKRKFFNEINVYLVLILIYSLITWFISSLTLYNLGLSTRQKYMFIPFLYLVIITFLSDKSKIDICEETN